MEHKSHRAVAFVYLHRCLLLAIALSVAVGMAIATQFGGTRANTANHEAALRSGLAELGIEIGTLSDGSPVLKLRNGNAGRSISIGVEGIVLRDSENRSQLSLEARDGTTAVTMRRYAIEGQEPIVLQLIVDRNGIVRVFSHHGTNTSPGFMLESLLADGAGVHVWDGADNSSKVSMEASPKQHAHITRWVGDRRTSRWP